jgi:hypothetical protein
MTIKAFANSINLRAAVRWTNRNPNMGDSDWAKTASHYRVTLTRKGGKQLSTVFSMGSAICREPEAVEVLDALISDASSVDGQSFESWCGEMGYDPDSRSAERTFIACVRTKDNLQRFLGDDYETAQAAERL